MFLYIKGGGGYQTHVDAHHDHRSVLRPRHSTARTVFGPTDRPRLIVLLAKGSRKSAVMGTTLLYREYPNSLAPYPQIWGHQATSNRLLRAESRDKIDND